ncbi:hypothetical protein Tco_0428336 [Tanacetum coccineum]
MSQPANDDFSQHLSDDEASYHEDASENGTATNKPKQQQQLIPTITIISNIKLLILKKEEYDIWAMEMEHYLEYIDNDVWKVIQNGNSKKRISTRKDGVVRILPPKIHGMDDCKRNLGSYKGLVLDLCSSWGKSAMAMKPNQIDTLSIDDLYNNFKQEQDTNKVKGPVIYSLFPKQSEDLDLLHEDIEQINDVDIEEMDINWQIAMIAIRMKKFYKKTGRRVRIDGNKPVSFDKKKLEYQGAGKKEQNQNCLLTMDDSVVNWGEHTLEEEETNHALMAISSNNEVSLCSKTYIDSYNKLKTLCDEQTDQLGEQEAKILAYTLAVKKLEAQVVTFQKQQLSLNEQLTFQANEECKR